MKYVETRWFPSAETLITHTEKNNLKEWTIFNMWLWGEDSFIIVWQQKETSEPKTRFVPPRPQEVEQYAEENGYKIDGHVFIDYYSNRGWKNSNGKPVRNWKLTMREVWFTQKNRALKEDVLKPKTY